MSLDREPTLDDVKAAYEMLLGRQPESLETVAGHKVHFRTVRDLRQAFLASAEFRAGLAEVPYFLRDKWVRTEIGEGLCLWVNLKDNLVSRACLDEGWELDVTSYLLANIKKGDCFIDVGANIGWFTILVASRLRELGGGQVISFEPRSDMFRMLSRSVADNALEPYVRLYNAALADRGGTMQLYWHTDNENAAASALAPNGVPEGTNAETVSLMRLDDIEIAGPLTLIKSDAEGAEGLVFAGATELIKRWRPTIVAELNIHGLPAVSGISADAFLHRMSMHGYTCRLLEEGGRADTLVLSAADTGDEAASVVFS